MKILITTGVYPPKIGGPAQYAKNLKETFEKIDHKVVVKTYGVENILPTGIRHLFFFLKIFFTLPFVDAVIVLDTFSVGLPTIFACKLFGQKGIIRTGGDFLWEQYTERTGKKVLFRNFYDTEIKNFSFKERIIFKLTRWTLNNASKVVFSTEWQRDIFIKAYNVKPENTWIVENYYGPKESDCDFESKTFIASVRNLVWKNLDILKKVFDKVSLKNPEAKLFTDNPPYNQFMEKMAKSYAVILVSLGDISPNMITDAIRYNRPFICTKEVGTFERIKNAGIFVDPLNEKEIEDAISNLLTEEGYSKAKEKVRNFNFIHTWQEIADFYLRLMDQTKESFWKKSIFLRYFVCGITSAGLNILALFLFTEVANIWYLYSSVLAFLVSLIVSFILQKFVVFKDLGTNGLHYQFSKFFVALVLGVITNTFVMYICVDILGIWYIFSQIIAGFFAMIQNFIFYRFFIFKK